MTTFWAGQTARWLRVLTALEEELALVSSTKLGSLKSPLTPLPGDQMSSGLGRHLDTHDTEKLGGTQRYIK